MWILAFLGKDPRTAQSSDARNSLFATNLEDRGPSNLLKKRYMTALTCDKLRLYESKIDAAVNKFYNDVTTGAKPVMSSWYERVLELYLDLHLDGPSAADHPDYVAEYVRLFTDLIAPGREDYVLRLRRPEAARGACLLPFVEEYFEERRQFIVDNEITSTFVYWWNQAGMARESVLFEAVHNVLAWGQFLNIILFLVIRAQVQGFVAIENLLRDPATTTTFDFFQAMKQASTENERLDVAREAFRMLVPNQFWLSQAERLGAGYNDGRFIADSDFDRPYAILFPLVIQAINDNFSPFTFGSDVARYDTSRYADFQPDGCPFMNSQFITNVTAFIVLEVDGETVVPAVWPGISTLPGRNFQHFHPGEASRSVGEPGIPSPTSQRGLVRGHRAWKSGL